MQANEAKPKRRIPAKQNIQKEKTRADCHMNPSTIASPKPGAQRPRREFVDPEQVETVSFEDNHLSAKIRLAQLQSGRWIVATEHAFHTGNYAGHGSPLTGEHESYATRAEALELGKLALQREVAAGIHDGDSLVSDSQRGALERFEQWLSPAQIELDLASCG
jgi:hypothetical protein